MDGLEDIRETIKRLETERKNVTNVYEASSINPLVYFDGQFMLAMLMWLNFTAVIFLILLNVIQADSISGAAAAEFFIVAVMASIVNRRFE